MTYFTPCAYGSMTKMPCVHVATVQVRKPKSRTLGSKGPRRYVWQALCAIHDDHLRHGQEVRPIVKQEVK